MSASLLIGQKAGIHDAMIVTTESCDFGINMTFVIQLVTISITSIFDLAVKVCQV
jgi:hypothetical protein